MIYATYIDILKIHNEFSPDPLNTRILLTYYSIIEHEISNLGFNIGLYTKDVRNMDDVIITKAIKDILKDLVFNTLSGIPAGRDAKLSIYKSSKHFIITVA